MHTIGQHNSTLPKVKRSVRDNLIMLAGLATGYLVAWGLIQWDLNIFGPYVVFLVPAGGIVSRLILRLMNLVAED